LKQAQGLDRREFLALAAGAAINLASPGAGASALPVSIDITGSWRSSDDSDRIIVREPPIPRDDPRTFEQVLQLIPGPYSLEIDYSPSRDADAGSSLQGAFQSYRGLTVNDQVIPLTFLKRGNVFTAKAEFVAAESRTRLELAFFNTRAPVTRLFAARFNPHPRFHALLPKGEGELMSVRGMPFLLRKHAFFESTVGELGVDRGSLVEWRGGMSLDCKGAQARRLHFLGMIHNIDLGSASWYCKHGDHGYAHFVGDRAGSILLEYDGGQTDEVPLVFGYNIWFSKPWDLFWFFAPWGRPVNRITNYDAQLFAGNDRARGVLQNSLRLRDGLRSPMVAGTNARFVYSLELEGRPLRRIRVTGNDQLYDYPLISAVTLEGAESIEGLAALPDIAQEWDRTPGDTIADVRAARWQDPVKQFQETIYVSEAQLPKLREPEIPSGYFGPGYSFEGTQEAVYAATYLYRNGPECATHVADSGTACNSKTANRMTAWYTHNTGVWVGIDSTYGSLERWFELYEARNPGELPGTGEAWSRGIGELMRESMAFGYDKFVDSYVEWLDRSLFDDATPPHWIRAPGSGDLSPDYHVVTHGELKESGNRENDGHGICMWGRYMTWHWKGHSKEWAETHFKATEASVNWIQYQLDTDAVYPGARKDVLYSESECAHQGYDIYSTYNCLHGVRLAARMARATGRSQQAGDWERLERRLLTGILKQLVEESEDGPIWHTDPTCDWQDNAHKLVPIQLASDGDTFTPREDWQSESVDVQTVLKITISSYKSLLKSQDFDFLRAYGYGQGFMLQAALLLDEMQDATRLANLMVTRCYLPHMARWCAPEGILQHPSGKFWMPMNGYAGQDSHLADSVKAVRLMLGVDDNRMDELHLVPRYPQEWTRMKVVAFPVLTGGTRQHLTYSYKRSPREQAFEYSFSDAEAAFHLRLGPIDPSWKSVEVEHSGKPATARLVSSGDSIWVWTQAKPAMAGKIDIRPKL
jgi:hypothetical protein